jgi:hypothetical protein
MSDLLQFKIGTSATVMQTFTVDGLPADLDSGVPVVTISRPDGTTIASGTVSGAWAGPPARSTGQYRFVLAGQPECTILAVTWAGTIGGQPQTLGDTIEIVGADLFGLAAFRGLRVANGYPFAAGATPAYTDTQIRDTRTEILEEMTGILGFPPVPRFISETHDGYNNPIIVNQRVKPRLLAIKVGGVDQSISGYYLNPHGTLRSVTNYLAGAAFPYGYGNVEVEYAAGWERPLGECRDAAMIWAAKNLNPSGFSSATTISTPDGSTYTYERRGGFTGVADLDRWLERHRAVAGVA